MEGESPRKETRLRVQREFECSRIEQSLLAAAYQTILPADRVSFTERVPASVGADDRDPTRLQIDTADCSSQFVSAIGGH